MTENAQRPAGESPTKTELPSELSSTDMSLTGTTAAAREDPPSEDALAPSAGGEAQPQSEGFSLHVHGYLSGYVGLADQKAAFVFAYSVALLGLVHGGAATEHIVKLAGDRSAINIIATVAVLALVSALGLAAATIWPRMRGAMDGLVYWTAIRKRGSASVYAGAISGMDSAGVVDELARHCYELAGVCESKYKTLNWSLFAAGLGSVGSVLFLLLKV